VSARRGVPAPEVLVAAAAFVGLCVAVLTRSAQLLEPDDYAYRASIVALTQGHIALTGAEYTALARKLGSIMQWTQLPDGRWLSEKNPGYPFLAAPFQLLGILRVAPLFYGALGCLGLYAGGRRWLGRWGGTWAVLLYCASGAALVFAWRATMPTFTDASLVAAGTGALLWTMLAVETPTRRRALVGLLAFVAFEAAVAVRYTNVLLLVVALVAVALGRRPARIPLRTFGYWLASIGVTVALLAAFDAHYYGSPLATGYASGEITFSLSALEPNLRAMPHHLLRSMPLLLLAAASSAWIALRALRSLGGGVGRGRTLARRDAAVGAALLVSWLAIFGLYLTYTWTVGQAGVHDITVHVVRFYLPALGAVSLLAAWLLVRVPLPVTVATLGVVVCLAGITYPSLARAGFPGGAGAPPGSAPFGRQGGGFAPGGAQFLVPPTGPPPAGAPPRGIAPGGTAPGGPVPAT
jgi:hypothetical protein